MSALQDLDGPPPRLGRRMLLRFALGGFLIVFLGAAAVATALKLEIHSTVEAFVRETIPIRGVQNVLDDVAGGQAADDPASSAPTSASTRRPAPAPRARTR